MNATYDCQRCCRFRCDCPTVAIPRKSDGTINYAAIGSDLENGATEDQLARFASRYFQSTDSAMATLAVYARFTCKAKCHRLAGRIEDAMRNEASADTVYEREIKPENRW